jgi:fructokinase
VDGVSASAHVEPDLDHNSWPRVVCLGEALIDFVAVDADLGASSTFIRAAGAAPANVAVALTTPGNAGWLLRQVVERLLWTVPARNARQGRCGFTRLVVDDVARTPLAFVGSDGNGGRAFVFYHQGMADTRLEIDELAVTRELIAHARVFHFGSVTLADEPGAGATLHAAECARANGCIVSFDPNVRLEVWRSPEHARRTIVAAIALADVVKVSNDELEFLAATTDPVEACRKIARAWAAARGGDTRF